MRNPHPLSAQASRSVFWCCAGLLASAVLAGAVRILPWLLDPSVPMRVALPFIRGVVELAFEVAVIVGWPLGWALASERFAERGEARAMMLLGESPFASAGKQWRSAAPAALLLLVASTMGALDASAPGRTAQDLLSQGRTACSQVTAQTTYSVPFVSVTWLCAPGSPPRLYGSGPGSLHGVAFSAKDAHIAPDMRRIDLDDARFSLPSIESLKVDVHADAVVLHGMSPWTHASNVPPLLRALVVELVAAFAALLALAACSMRIARGTFAAVCVGVAGPIAALGLMRAMERANAPAALYLLAPIASVLAAAFATLVVRIARLR